MQFHVLLVNGCLQSACEGPITACWPYHQMLIQFGMQRAVTWAVSHCVQAHVHVGHMGHMLCWTAEQTLLCRQMLS
jgi:hypothetical protein